MVEGCKQSDCRVEDIENFLFTKRSCQTLDMNINSHVQAPKLLLKRFENDSGMFYYYDVKEHFIGSNGHAKTMNTIKNYYPSTIEKFLNRKIETPFATVLKELDQIDYDTTFQMPSDISEKVHRFMRAALARSIQLHSKICKDHKFKQKYTEREKHGLAMMSAFQSAEDMNYFEGFFQH